jgi:hypothetical protein
MRQLVFVAISCLATSAFAAEPTRQSTSQSSPPVRMAAGANSCSGWNAICDSRGGGARCDAQMSACLKSGCWTEGAQYGSAKHCGLAKK